MRFLGLDISSTSTGWSVVDVDDTHIKKLVEYGLICPVGGMGVTQRLYFFGNELKKIIDKFLPNEIAAEETVLVRGPKIMRTLSRFSGVALFLAYSYQKREIPCYEPSMWKKALGIKGSAKKPEIQLKVCEAFGLMDKIKIDKYLEDLVKIETDEKQIDITISKEMKLVDNEVKKAEEDLKKSTREFKRLKKKEQDTNKMLVLNAQEAELLKKKDYLKAKKKQCAEAFRDIVKRYEKISMDVYSDCGINADIADSLGVTLKAILDHESRS
jgi:Holliday junction resolvasome RuvABC endonuclease subunit